MLFSSIPFLYYFLPTVLLLYLVVPRNMKNIMLLLVSLFFYAWGEPRYIFVMLFSIITAYFFGLLIEKSRHTKWAVVILVLSLLCSLGSLLLFKYADFFLETINQLTSSRIPLLSLSLPIGISFYTFQIISYTADVFTGRVPAQKNLLHFATYVALFPQLIAGPIVRYTDIAEELTSRTHSIPQVVEGARRFLIGLSKKVLLANAFGEFCSLFRATTAPSVLFYWLYGAAFTLHIYFDFSGYSDMAIGLGHLFGFHFPENFRYPYCAKSITEFWRRWHMTLGQWFRDYVYIPLGGNRVSTPKHIRNICVVWALTGLWHGASWNFVLWGLLFAVLLLFEKYIVFPLQTSKMLRNRQGISRKIFSSFFCHSFVLFFVILSFVLFNADSLGQAVSDFRSMFGLEKLPLLTLETVYYFRSYMVLFLLGILGATPLPTTAVGLFAKTAPGKKILPWIEGPVLALLLLMVTAYLVDGSFNPFLYFRF